MSYEKIRNKVRGNDFGRDIVKIRGLNREIIELIDRCRDERGKLLLRYYGLSEEGEDMLMNSIASWEVHRNLMEKIKGVFPEAIIYKGFWTSRFYEEPYLRFISDVDVLVRWEDYHRAIEIMEGLGFEGYSDIPHTLPGWMRRRLEWETSMRKGLAMIEIHIRPFPPYFLEIDMEDLFENATPWFGNFLQLNVEYNLFLNVLHFYKSTRRSVFHIIDTLILSKRADMERLRGILKKHRVNEGKFFRVMQRILECGFPMESPFHMHGFYFASNRAKAILIFLMVKGLKRLLNPST